MSGNQFFASFLGFRGSEDLGDGMRALFRIETGINTDNGTPANATKFWNRQSFVGLENQWATITLGRQFQASTERVIQTLDVYNVAGPGLATTPLALFGVNKFSGNDTRVDDSVKLRLRGPDGLTGAITLAPTENNGRSRSMDIAKVGKDFSVGAYWVNYRSPTFAPAVGDMPEATSWGIGGNAMLGPVKLYVHYMSNTLEPSAAGRVDQKNRIINLGAAYWPATQVQLRAAWVMDKGTAMNGVLSRDGKKSTGVMSADYYLSKRTSLSAGFFTNRFTDGYRLDPVNIAALGRDPAASSTTGYTLGIRHDF